MTLFVTVLSWPSMATPFPPLSEIVLSRTRLLLPRRMTPVVVRPPPTESQPVELSTAFRSGSGMKSMKCDGYRTASDESVSRWLVSLVLTVVPNKPSPLTVTSVTPPRSIP